MSLDDLRAKVRELARFRRGPIYHCPERRLFCVRHEDFLRATVLEYGPRKVLRAVVDLAPVAEGPGLRRLVGVRRGDARTRAGRERYVPVVLRALRMLKRKR